MGRAPFWLAHSCGQSPALHLAHSKHPIGIWGTRGLTAGRGRPGNAGQGALALGLGGARLSLEAPGFCQTHKVGGAAAGGQCEAPSAGSWLWLATCLPVPAPPRPSCVSWASCLPSLCLALLLGSAEAAAGPSPSCWARGPRVPPGGAHRRRRRRAGAAAAGARKGLKPALFNCQTTAGD